MGGENIIQGGGNWKKGGELNRIWGKIFRGCNPCCTGGCEENTGEFVVRQPPEEGGRHFGVLTTEWWKIIRRGLETRGNVGARK